MFVIDAAARPVCAYFYDPRVLRERITAVRAALPSGARLYYAMKANSHPALLSVAAECADGVEVASGGELTKGVAAGAASIIFSGPAKTDAELAAAVAVAADIDMCVNVESVWELRRLSAVATRPIDVCLRVNRPDVGLAGSHRMTGTPTAFGIDSADVAEVIEVAGSLPRIRLRGLHVHAVSNNLDAAAHARFVREAVAFTDRVLPGADIVNVGGGLGVDYTGGRVFDVAAFAAGLPDDPRLVFEVGRYLVADAGWYAVEVIDIKRTHSRWFAVVRGGTHHFRLPAAWGYDHPFTVYPVQEWPYRLPRPEVRDVVITAVGELCTPRDVLCREQYVDRLRVGDVLVFARTGAYGYEVSHHDFLSHEPPQFLIGDFFIN